MRDETFSHSAPYVAVAQQVVLTRWLTWIFAATAVVALFSTRSFASPNPALLDCNNNGIDDSFDIASGTSEDCNADGVPDSCDPDCNGNDIADACDIAAGDTDKDQDGVPDSCEYARGDFDLDDCIGGIDMSMIIATWGMTDIPVCDLDGNGSVGGGDLVVVLANWGCSDP